MQRNLHKAPLCNITLCHCVFNPVMSLLQLSLTGDLTSHHCLPCLPGLSPLKPSLHFVPPAKLNGIIFPVASSVASPWITSSYIPLCFVPSYPVYSQRMPVYKGEATGLLLGVAVERRQKFWQSSRDKVSKSQKTSSSGSTAPLNPT